MKYFLDTEFHEFEKPVKFAGITFGKIHTIDLISIGMVSEDGREYSAVCNEFDVDEAWNSFQMKEVSGNSGKISIKEYWLRENVLRSVYEDLVKEVDHTMKEFVLGSVYDFNLKSLKLLLQLYGQSKASIANDICAFIYGHDCGGSGMSAIELARKYEFSDKTKLPEFYAYFADYAWVVFCWLFGRMIDLPKGFPYYCKDLKQMMDDRGFDKEWKQKNCPDPQGEHNALIDAKWNLKLFNLISENTPKNEN